MPHLQGALRIPPARKKRSSLPPLLPFTTSSQEREAKDIGPSELDNWVLNGIKPDGEVVPLMTMSELVERNPIAALFVGLFTPREK